MSVEVVIGLLTNIILLMSLSVIYSLFTSGTRLSQQASKIVMGVSVSIVGFVIMSTAVEVEPGIIFDGRSILMLLAGMYFGLVPTLIGGVTLSAYRIYLGGNGVIPGVIWVLIPGIIGLIWRHYRLKKSIFDISNITVLEQYLLVFTTQVLMVGILFLFPNKVSVEAINAVALPLVIFYPVGGLAVSIFMLRQRYNYFQSINIKEREKEYSDLFHKGSSYSLLINPESGRIMNVNQVAINRYGYTFEEFTQMTIYDLNLLPREELINIQQKAKNKKLDYTLAKHILKSKEVIDVEVRSVPITIAGEVLSYATITDITSRIEGERKYQDVNVRLEATLHSVTEGVISTNVYGEIEIINDVAKQYLSLSDSAIGKRITSIVRIYSEKNNINFEDIYNQVISTNKSFKSEKPCTLLNNEDDSKIYIDFSLSPIKYDDDTIQGTILVLRDITSEFEKSNKIEYVSQHDFLTGLYNRYFLEVEMKRLDTKRQLPITIIHGDVNGLKLTNDAFGHVQGDNLLKEVALIFKKATRSEDIIARWGGDEFIIFLPQTSRENAEKVRERIIDLQNKSMFEIMTPSVSLGIATKTTEGEDLAKVLVEAETEMYSNKQQDGKKMRNEFLAKMEKHLYTVHPDLGNHAATVAAISKEFGEYLNLPDDDLSDLINLSIYHDIGWIAIEKELLLKKGPLTNSEKEKVQSHPEVGFRIMKSIPELSHLADLMFHHHERWDGLGYPSKLKKKEIPLLDRILVITDSFDMMINNSVYTPCITIDEGLEELKKEAGKQFDPELVNQFVEMYNKKKT